MEKLTVKAPEGYEFSGINDNGEIEFSLKKIEYPLSVNEIKNRKWYITGSGIIHELEFDFYADRDINNVSTEGRAKAILALTQLLELRDAWNNIDEFAPDWRNYSQVKYCIVMEGSKVRIDTFGKMDRVLSFGSFKTAERFLTEFKSLIETAKELL